MQPEALLKDPVFQLNLLLWMVKKQPSEGYCVLPFFSDLEFEIAFIEHPYTFPEETRQAIASSGLDIGMSPEPDLILWREGDNRALYFEAKSNSFGPVSTSTRQARAHLLASGPAFSEVFVPQSSCLLCYVVPNEKRGQMSDCLATLTDELNSNALEPGPFSCHGLSLEGTGIAYTWDSAFKLHTGTAQDQVVIVNNVSEVTDPSPLILLFSDEDCSNLEDRDRYRRIVIERVRACLLCDLHSLSVGKTYETTPEMILIRTTDGLFEYWGRKNQKGLQRLVQESIFKRIFDHWQGKQTGVSLDGYRLSITWNMIAEKKSFLDWLEDHRRTNFAAARLPVDATPDLFDGSR